jgi:hypothetical protein
MSLKNPVVFKEPSGPPQPFTVILQVSIRLNVLIQGCCVFSMRRAIDSRYLIQDETQREEFQKKLQGLLDDPDV